MQTPSMSSESPAFFKLLGHDLRWQLLRALAHSDYRVQELVEQVGRPINLVSYHLRQLRQVHLVTERHSSADGRDVYYSLDLERLGHLFRRTSSDLHPSLEVTEHSLQDSIRILQSHSVRVLFLCTRNSARSQMAEGMLRHLSSGYVHAYSAGDQPAEVHPYAIQAMAALGVDISHQQAKHLEIYRQQPFDCIITVCDIAREDCPIFAHNAVRLHWSIPDPVGDVTNASYADFVDVAQNLSRRTRHLLARISAGIAHDHAQPEKKGSSA